MVRVGEGGDSLYIEKPTFKVLEPFKRFVASGLVVGWEVVDGGQSYFSDHQ